MKVEEYGRATYLVTDQSGTWTVDTLSYGGNGKCDCWNFTRKGGLRDQIELAIQQRTFQPGPYTECPHISAANRALLTLFKLQLIKQFGDSEQHT
jgi:hypothetical protein